MLHLLEVMVVAFTLVVITFLVLLALPNCKIRQLLMHFVAWLFVVACALYVVSPLDLMPEILGPFGVVDDFAAVVAGVSTAMVTMRAQRQKHPHYSDPYFN